ncbi:hypothetical protein JCM8547_003963 [Rhodosporidiobolus lusitaniae]
MPNIITHIVSLCYKPSTSSAEKHLVGSRFLALQDQCLLPSSWTAAEDQAGKPYLSVTGGRNNSPEGANKGFEHAWVVTFDSIEARDYYLDTDPVHQDFKAFVKDFVEDVFVVDFEAGVFSIFECSR